jgi:preprotein translocase subunit SecA
MLTNLIKKVFGDKNTKALKELWPIVDEINKKWEPLKNISEDELKHKTVEFKNIINERTKELRAQIDEINEKLKQDELDENREDLYEKLDKLNKELDQQYEDVLNELLPEAFAVVKETCRRLVGQS